MMPLMLQHRHQNMAEQQQKEARLAVHPRIMQNEQQRMQKRVNYILTYTI
jgi:hypothetical protein